MKEAVTKFKKDYFLTFALILILIPLVLLSVAKAFSSRAPSIQPARPEPHPTQILPSEAPLETAAPTLAPYLRLMKSVQNRKGLSAVDEEAKRRILSPLAGESGTLYRTENVSIEYIGAPDIFQAEILSTNVSGAKNEAVAWFLSQGATIDGICKLPVQFFLNKNVSESLGPDAAAFSPLPEGC